MVANPKIIPDPPPGFKLDQPDPPSGFVLDADREELLHDPSDVKPPSLFDRAVGGVKDIATGLAQDVQDFSDTTVDFWKEPVKKAAEGVGIAGQIAKDALWGELPEGAGYLQPVLEKLQDLRIDPEFEQGLAEQYPNLMAVRHAMLDLVPGPSLSRGIDEESFLKKDIDLQRLEIEAETAGWALFPAAMKGVIEGGAWLGAKYAPGLMKHLTTPIRELIGGSKHWNRFKQAFKDAESLTVEDLIAREGGEAVAARKHPEVFEALRERSRGVDISGRTVSPVAREGAEAVQGGPLVPIEKAPVQPKPVAGPKAQELSEVERELELMRKREALKKEIETEQATEGEKLPAETPKPVEKTAIKAEPIPEAGVAAEKPAEYEEVEPPKPEIKPPEPAPEPSPAEPKPVTEPQTIEAKPKAPEKVKEPWEMTREEFENRINSASNNQYSKSSTVDWGNLRGQGKRVGRQVMGGMRDSSLQGKKTYIDILGELPKTDRDNAYESLGNEPMVLSKYAQARAAGFDHNTAILRAYQVTDKSVDVHRHLIEKALSENKPVPPEVLAEYPKLKAKPKDVFDKAEKPAESIDDLIEQIPTVPKGEEALYNIYVGLGERKKINRQDISSFDAVQKKRVTVSQVVDYLKEKNVEIVPKQTVRGAKESPKIKTEEAKIVKGKELTAEARQIETERLKKENADILSTPLLSEGSISPYQVSRMSKRQKNMWMGKAQKRMEIESQIKELSKSNEQLRAERHKEIVRRNKGRLLQIERRVEDLERIGMGKRGKIKPSYQKEIDRLKVEKETILKKYPEVKGEEPKPKDVFDKAEKPEPEIKEPEKAEIPKERLGNTETAYNPEGSEFESIKAQYAAVEIKDLVASHDTEGHINKAYPSDLQPRDRSRTVSRLQIKEIAAGVKPPKLGASAKTSDGAPIVGEDLVVESGNARVVGLKGAYANKKADNYKEWLQENAETFGLTAEEIAKLDNPVLVRIRKTYVDLVKCAEEANR